MFVNNPVLKILNNDRASQDGPFREIYHTNLYT